MKIKKSKLKEIIKEEIYLFLEKWEKEVDVKSTGEHADKSIEQLEKEMDAMVGSEDFDREKYSELQFAWRAKKGWPDRGYKAEK